MCSNYEAQLLNAQGKIHDLEKHIMSLERYKQELSKETTFRKEMEAKWNEKKEKYKEQVSNLIFLASSAVYLLFYWSKMLESILFHPFLSPSIRSKKTVK